MKTFDLTKKETYEAIQKVAINSIPILSFGKYVLDKFVGEEPSPEVQKQTAKEIIRESKEMGAKEVEITLDSGAAIDLTAECEVPIKIGGHIGNKTTVKVTF